MTGIASSTMLPLELAVVAIGLSMVLGVADVARLPNWAWRKAEEPKIAYLALVGLLPVVGLGMYLVRARPKVKAVAAAGRAASLPFERFGDGAPPMDEEQVAEAPEPIQLVAMTPDLPPALASPALLVRGRIERAEGSMTLVAERFEPLELGPTPPSRAFR